MTSTKRALITGVTGQDGAYLSKLLLEKGYDVYGAVRRGGSHKTQRLEFLDVFSRIKLIDFDLLELSNIQNTIAEIKPDEIYNLAGQSFVPSSWNIPLLTTDTNGTSVLRILDSIKSINKDIKFYQASTSEMFGKVHEIPQNEKTIFYPRSPYGVAKLFGHHMTVNYRESYDMFACSGILFNHESALRGQEFVTKKITKTLVKIKNGSKNPLLIGNIEAKRDWGHAKDYVNAMYLMLNHTIPDDYVVSTGKLYSVKEFIDLCLNLLKFNYVWSGDGMDAIAINKDNNNTIIKVDKIFFRPAEVDLLLGDSYKIKDTLNWKPEYSFEMLVEEMVKFEIDNPNINF